MNNEATVIKSFGLRRPDDMPLIIIGPNNKNAKPLKLVYCKYLSVRSLLCEIRKHLGNNALAIYLYVICNGTTKLVSPNLLVGDLSKYARHDEILRLHYMEESMFGTA
jgi:hypothetical protein